MTAIDSRLGDYVERDEFARMVNRSPRTITRWMSAPDGLPHLPFGNETLIPIPQARDWLAGRIRHPNRRRERA